MHNLFFHFLRKFLFKYQYVQHTHNPLVILKKLFCQHQIHATTSPSFNIYTTGTTYIMYKSHHRLDYLIIHFVIYNKKSYD